MSIKPIRKHLFLLIVLCVTLLVVGCAKSMEIKGVQITVDAGDTKGDISTMLTGVNVVFSHETDSLWADGRIAGYLKDVRAGTLRFPGGERVDYYHYFYPNNPDSLYVDTDPWQTDPNAKDYSGTDKTNSEFMDVDEYIYWCGKIGAEPMLGINMESGLLFDRIDDSIKEAVDIVRYCNVTRNYNVKYWYLSNEPHFTDASHYHLWTIEKYARHVKMFSKAMKAVDPNIKIIVNWHSNLSEPTCWANWQYLLETAGANFDIADVHWYWAWGYCTWNLWLEDNPMIVREWCRVCPNQRYLGPSFAEEISRFHKKVKAIAYDVRLAALEWNIGPNDNFRFSRFQHALMQAEMLGQYIEGGLHMACMWPLTWSRGDIVGKFRAILDQQNHRPTPSFSVFKLYSNVLGQKLLTSQTSRAYIRPVSALSQDGNTLWVYLLNKAGDGQPVRAVVDIGGFTPASAEAIALTAPDLSSDVGKLKKLKIRVNSQTGKWYSVLPPYSLTMLTFRK